MQLTRAKDFQKLHGQPFWLFDSFYCLFQWKLIICLNVILIIKVTMLFKIPFHSHLSKMALNRAQYMAWEMQGRRFLCWRKKWSGKRKREAKGCIGYWRGSPNSAWGNQSFQEDLCMWFSHGTWRGGIKRTRKREGAGGGFQQREQHGEVTKSCWTHIK